MPSPPLPLAALAERLGAQPGALIALDLGTKRIGIASSDVRRRLVVPRAVLTRTKFTADARAILAHAAEAGAAAIVIGLPLNMDGSEGPRAQSARAFARHLAPLTGLPLTFVDERLSSVEAEDILARAGVPPRRRRELVDAAAAAVILEDALKVLAPAP